MYELNSRLGALSWFVVIGAITWSCGSGSPADHDGAIRLSQADSSSFVKHGDNGTASCDVYCAGAQWGLQGFCVGASASSFPCNQTPGFLSAQLTCECVDPGSGQVYEKDGDNGTASCDTFCAGAQWGRVGSCVGASIQSAPCRLTPGLLDNGSEWTCTCEPNSPTGTGCTKAKCTQFAGSCGIQSDGCGGSIDCSNNCPSGETCDGAVCIPSCTPLSQSAACAGQNGGTAPDGCGNFIDCPFECQPGQPAEGGNGCVDQCGQPMPFGTPCLQGIESDICSNGECGSSGS